MKLITRTVLLVALVGLASCSSSSDSKSKTLTLTVKEFSISASSSKAVSGPVTVTVQNKGKIAHEIVAFRTDLDEKSLPLTADGHKVDEEGQGITHLDPEAEDVTPDGSKTITIDLPAGRYVFVCNIEDHYKQGMRAVVTTS